MNVANMQLSLNPITHQAYLVPFWNKKINSFEADLMIGYQGLIDKITAAGAVRNIETVVVYENDEFAEIRGTSPQIIHKPTRGKRGNPTHVYSIGFLKDVGFQFEVMTWDEIEKVRSTSISYNYLKEKGREQDSIWGMWSGEMAKKTVIRRLAKVLPKNSNESLRKAMSLDDTDFKAAPETISFVEGLIDNSTLDDDAKQMLDDSLEDASLADIQSVIQMLHNHQKRPSQQYAPSQRELAKEIKEIGQS